MVRRVSRGVLLSGLLILTVGVAPDGSADLVLPDNVRSYFLAGAQHSPGAFPPVHGLGQQPGNPLDYWWTLRALLVAMDGWVRDGTAPPMGPIGPAATASAMS